MERDIDALKSDFKERQAQVDGRLQAFGGQLFENDSNIHQSLNDLHGLLPHKEGSVEGDEVHVNLKILLEGHESLWQNAFNYGIEISTVEWISAMMEAGLNAEQVLQVWDKRNGLANTRKNLDLHE